MVETPSASGPENSPSSTLEEPREWGQSIGAVDNFYSPQNQDFYSSFKYTSLDRGKREIRLLRITMDGGELDNNSPIACEISENWALKDAIHRFIALSYCAGNPNETERLVVNGVKFNAFARLGHGIRQARCYWKAHGDNDDLLIWVDQICINQSVPEERSHQVNFMGDIYDAAKITLISLSDDNSPSGGLEWLTSYDESLAIHRDQQSQHPFEKCLTDESQHYGLGCFITVVLQSPYWQRAWVRQEYARSCTSIFMASFEFCEGETFEKALEHYFDLLNPIHAHENSDNQSKDYWREKLPEYCPIEEDAMECMACQPFCNTAGHYYEFRSTQDLFTTKALGNINLLDHIMYGGKTVASDPRDRIFAFLGLSSVTYGLTADYSPYISLEDVLCQLARHVINHEGHLGSLMATKRRYVKEPPQDLPLWVPDWIATDPLEGLPYEMASVNDFSRSQCVARFLPDDSGRENRILQVRGGIASDMLNIHDLPSIPEDWRGFQDLIEIWWIYGLRRWCALYRHGRYYMIHRFVRREEATNAKQPIWILCCERLEPDYDHEYYND